MQFTKLSDFCDIDLLKFSPRTKKRLSATCITAASPAALPMGCAFPLGHGGNDSARGLWHHTPLCAESPRAKTFRIGDLTK